MIEEIQNKLDRPIVFAGLMGAGKSTIGAAVANQLGLGFTDSDAVITAKEQKSIEQIFAEDGEAYFRSLERKTIEQLIQEQNVFVLGVGGGAFMNDQTRAVLLESAIVIFLKADFATLQQRVGSGEGRPLFKGKNVEQVLKDLILARYPVYEQAQITVESGEEGEAETAHKVIAALYNYLGSA